VTQRRLTHQRIVSCLPRLFGYAFSLTLDRDASRDLVQECALNALKAKRVPSDDAAFRAWLFTILRNRFLDQRRHAARAAANLSDIPPEDDAGTWHQDDMLINRITVRNGLEQLDPIHREVVALVDISGFSYAETARMLDIPPGTVMSRLSRGRRALLNTMREPNVHVLPPVVRRSSS